MIGTCGAWSALSPICNVVKYQSLRSRFLYDFVTFPNGVFSGTIISSIIPDGNIKRTAEFQLLLGAIALPGVFVGALLCNPFGRRNTVRIVRKIFDFQR